MSGDERRARGIADVRRPRLRKTDRMRKPDTVPPPPVEHSRRRILLVLLVASMLGLLLSFDELHVGLLALLERAEPVIQAHPLLGVVIFVLLSAGSAMLAFFSSMPLIPVAVYTWGEWLTGVLLWLGWWLGGWFAYGVGSLLHRPLIATERTTRLLEFYRTQVSGQTSFVVVLLVQLALPSEIPGYLFGLLRVPLRIYLLALALAELPFAAAAVLAGDSLLQQRGSGLLLLAVLALGLSLGALALLRRRLRRDDRH